MIPDHIERASERWKSVGTLPESDLLRLAITRDLMHDLHADKSRFLSKGQKEQTAFFKSHEKKMEEIRCSSPLNGDLKDILSGSVKLKKRTRLLPDGLFTNIAREKFERYDRQWEAAVASEACQLSWPFWALDASLDLQKIDDWNRRLNSFLWPNGIVLFVESISLENEAATWTGRWILVLKPDFRNPAESFPDFNQWPGTRSQVVWRLLFSPKHR
jgi:hypothetical protein